MTHKLRKSRNSNVKLPKDDIFENQSSNQNSIANTKGTIAPNSKGNPFTLNGKEQQSSSSTNSINSTVSSTSSIQNLHYSNPRASTELNDRLLIGEENVIQPVFRKNKRKRPSLNLQAKADILADQDLTRKRNRVEESKREINTTSKIILEKIIALKDKDSPYVSEFINPVNPKVEKGYNKVVDRPICLSDMLAKTERMDYDTFDDLRVDLEIMLQNANKYQQYMKSHTLTETMKRIKGVAEPLLRIYAKKHLPINVTFDDFEKETPIPISSRGKSGSHYSMQIVPYGKIKLSVSDFDSIRELIQKGIYIYSTDVSFREDLKRIFYRSSPIVGTGEGYTNSCRPSKEIGLKHILLDMEKQNQRKHQGIIQTHYQFKQKGKKTSRKKLASYEDIAIFKNDKDKFRDWKNISIEWNREGEKLVLEYHKLFPQWYFMQRFSMRSIILSGLGCLYELANTYWIRMMKQLLLELKDSETAYFSIVAGFDSKIHISNLFKDLLSRLAQDAHQTVEKPKTLVGQAEKICKILEDINEQWTERHLPTYMRNLSLAQSWSRQREPESEQFFRTTVYILIHSVDSLQLRDEDFQRALCILMSSPHISCVLTYTSIYSRLLYDLHMGSSGKPYFCDCSTFRPFEVGGEEFQSKTQSQSDTFEIFKTNLRGMTKNVQDFIKLFVLKLNQFHYGATINELVDFCREEQTLHTWVGDYSKLENILLEPLENKMLRKKSNRYFLNVSPTVAEKLQAYFRNTG